MVCKVTYSEVCERIGYKIISRGACAGREFLTWSRRGEMLVVQFGDAKRCRKLSKQHNTEMGGPFVVLESDWFTRMIVAPSIHQV